MAIVRWNPVGQLAGMEIDRLNRMFNELYQDNFTRGWTPAVDIYQAEGGQVVIKADLPDVKRENISVTFENNVLTLKGERKGEEIARDRFQRVERFHGTFTRSFTLPPTVDPGNISATYKDGLLTVRLPQRAEAKPKQIAVGE